MSAGQSESNVSSSPCLVYRSLITLISFHTNHSWCLRPHTLQVTRHFPTLCLLPPFPYAVNGSLHSLHIPSPIILISRDFMHFFFPKSSVLAVCHKFCLQPAPMPGGSLRYCACVLFYPCGETLLCISTDTLSCSFPYLMYPLPMCHQQVYH